MIILLANTTEQCIDRCVGGDYNNYDRDDIPDVKKIHIDDVSLLIPKVHQEYIIMFYIKSPDNKRAITKLRESLSKIKIMLSPV